MPDPATFAYLGFHPGQVIELDSDALGAIPVAPPLPSLAAGIVQERDFSRPPDGRVGLDPRIAGALIALGIFVIMIAIVVIPAWTVPIKGLSPALRLEALSSRRTSLVQLFAAAVVLVGFFFTYQSLLVSRRTLSATTDNQLAERYAKSLELVDAANSVDVRLGGILALDRIARTSEADRETIARFLSTLLVNPAPEGSREPRAAVEIAAMLAAIAELRELGFATPLHLSGLALQDLGPLRLGLDGCDLTGAEWMRLSVRSSNLSRACLLSVSMQDVDLRYSQLERIMARSATISHCDLSWCNLEGAVFIGADLRHISLVGSRLDRALFIGADLREANLRRTDLRGADLTDADLRGALVDRDTLWPPAVDPAERGVVTGE